MKKQKSLDKAIKNIQRKNKILEKENKKWRLSNPSYKKGDFINVTLQGIVVNVYNIDITTCITIYLEESGDIVDIYQPDDKSSIKMR